MRKRPPPGNSSKRRPGDLRRVAPNQTKGEAGPLGTAILKVFVRIRRANLETLNGLGPNKHIIKPADFEGWKRVVRERFGILGHKAPPFFRANLRYAPGPPTQSTTPPS
jgi:hypothetical protein